MFAKLKKKIAEEEGVQGADLKRSSSQTGLARRESLNSWGSTSSLSGAAASASSKQVSIKIIKSSQP